MKVSHGLQNKISNQNLKFCMAFGVLLLSGCKSGITFPNKVVAQDEILPPIIKSAVPANIYKYDLKLLTGMLAIRGQDGSITTYLRAVDQEPLVSVVPESKRLIYKSIISGKGNATLRAAGISAEISGDQIAQLTINQTEVLALSDIPYQKVIETSKKIHPRQGQELIYITAATLYHSNAAFLDKIESNSTVEYGPVFGINGGVYKSSDVVRNDYLIYLHTISVGDLSQASIEQGAPVNTTKVTGITLPGNTAPQLSVVAPEGEAGEVKPAQEVRVDAPVKLPIVPVKFDVPKETIDVKG